MNARFKIAHSPLFLSVLLTCFTASAKEIYNDAIALNGMTSAKGVFLIDFKTAKKTAFYMDLIVGTYNGLVRQNVEPEMVVVII